MRLTIDVHLDYGFPAPADVLLQVEAAALPDQRLIAEALTVWSDTPVRAVAGEEGWGQRCWAHGDGRLVAEYRATVEVTRARIDLASLAATPPRLLPAAAIAYLLPSRYCPSDRFEGFVRREFAGLEGGALAAALVEWVREAVDYRGTGSTGTTTALDTFASRAGVCRDYAHLVVALARAADIPARCVSVYAPGVDPPDFHAVAELWLGGAWHLVDATGMAACEDLVKVAAGRDATDIAFMTIFGTATLLRQEVHVAEIAEREPAPGRSDREPTEAPMPDIDDRALDSLSVAPDQGGPSASDPRQEAGQDESIAKRLERNPESQDAKLDTGLDESMDASDPPAATQPGHGEPAASSGYDEEAERRLQQGG